MDEEQVVYRTGPGGAVEVLKSSCKITFRKITFVCTKCGCHFRVPVHLVSKMDSILFHNFRLDCRNICSYKCPECGDECLSS